MKKLLVIAMLALVSCTSQSEKITIEAVKLIPPEKTKTGYIRVIPKGHYYIDTNSIWTDNKEPELIYFEVVVNLVKGYHIYPKHPNEYAKSARQLKIVNCKNHRLTRMDVDYYSDFWGEGLRQTVRNVGHQTIDLKPGSTLDTVASILCANYSNH